ncbi:mannitol dehydrogenase family protein [Aurantimonas sp. Leaf443]|uniref:mannitol dehydrogenase family protein n=1 Tax=Aurantimonas sp. Leaf443 TaxID=1736378 RepID=UPI0006F83820|nr:mannitol dehydrogenase family protein [Aurantimonas sp. Leaf443]KQT85370.1 mannitol dehydrogenase [Aurantimonas sp. Leaf443]
MSVTLSSATLPAVARTVAVPSYDRAALTAGILHFGVGNFHRAHQGVYLDALFETGKGHDFAIVGAGVLPLETAMRDKLAAQDFLTTVVEQDSDRSAARVTGPMIEFLPIGDAAAIVARLADPAIRIVSLTITEGGYFVDSTGHFDPAHPAIAADGAHPEAPKTVFGLIVAGLKARRARGVAPFTVMSCDNIPHNGAVTLDAVAGTAELSDPELAAFIRGQVAFPNSMVDRITPATSAREIEHLEATFGIADQWPVYCEEFKQWVMEDRFPTGRPALEEVGVTFVEDVAPYELMKIRILNGGHAAIAYPGVLLDIRFVHEVMEHPLIRAFLAKLTREEIIPVVPPVPDTSLEDYARLIEHRFSNPKIGDTAARLALDGSNRQPKFIVPTIRDRLAAGKGIDGLALVSALWCRALGGPSESGREMPLVDPNLDRIRTAAEAARTDPSAFLALKDVYGDLAADETFATAFATQLRSLWEKGVEATLRDYLA